MGAGPSGCFALTQPDRFATGACSFFKLANPHSLSLANLATVQLGNLTTAYNMFFLPVFQLSSLQVISVLGRTLNHSAANLVEHSCQLAGFGKDGGDFLDLWI